VNTNLDKLFSIISENHNMTYDVEKIERAYVFAARMHEGQFRVSGEPYITHPVAVAEIVASLELDTDSICAALLHDTVEDCNVSIETIKKEFGVDVSLLVDGLTKLVHIPFEDKEEQQMENLRKMFMAMSKDVRVIFIKLCDRLHNMRTLSAKEDEKRRITALETMHVYAPLAHRLGIQRIKTELENLSLSYLDPIGYAEVKGDIEKRYGKNRDFINNIKSEITEKLKENGFSFTVDGRIKSVYSIYFKMYNQHKSLDEIYDFYAVRIITKTELECYTALGIIHDTFKSIPGRFKDYISTPKPNMYQSLHTTVIGKEGIPFEVQIRTEKMHQIAEFGVAAHWKYKSGDHADGEIDRRLQWIAKLIEAEGDTRDHDEFMRALKVDIFQDEIFVFTPKGDVISLPTGATLIDFAYAIHSQVGNRMIGAKVNGMITPIDRTLQNGEIAEILTSSASKGPSRDWLNIVKTSEARNKIRQWFKKEKRSENIAVGKAEIEKEISKFGREYTAAQMDLIVNNVATRMGFHEADDLYSTIGYGGLTVSKVAIRLHDEFDRLIKPEEPAPIAVDQITTKPHAKKNSSGVVVDGVDGCEVKFAKCCNPLPGDDIVGFITKGFGISIHKRDCPNVKAGLEKEENRDRFVTATWGDGAVKSSGQSTGGTYEAYVQIFAENDMMLLANITSTLADMRVALHQINTRTKDGMLVVNLVVGCRDVAHFKAIMARLAIIPKVNEVRRGYST
jgi:GTP diphosphokinase / guanosine-3',5'-bis(diphosphate) 3'-diphosphatase